MGVSTPSPTNPPQTPQTPQTPKKGGRPKKADAPRIVYHELDRLLVFGELVDDGTGRGPATIYPSYRQLAERFGVNHSVIAEYSTHHNCLRRRETAKLRVEARTEDKLVEIRAETVAQVKARILETVDAFLAAFGKALGEERVRVDSVSDFNLMVRLREYLQGGPDSRQEMHATLSLDEIQRRYHDMLRKTAEGGGLPEVTGMLPQRTSTTVPVDSPRADAIAPEAEQASAQSKQATEADDGQALDGADEENPAASD
jgi:hypothetical protein